MRPIILIMLFAMISTVSAQQQMSMPMDGRSTVALDTGLGSIDHPVSTKSAEAQKYFDQGLAYLYAFNHQEGINSFKQALKLDPNLAMAYWGIALALGSNYNVPADEGQ